MKVGDTFIHKISEGEWRVLEVARDDGVEMYRATCTDDDNGTWFSAGRVEKSYRVISQPPPVPTVELGDILHCRGCDLEVVEMRDGEVRLYCLGGDLSDAAYGFGCCDAGWRSLESVFANYTLPERHRFYVEKGILHCGPPLDVKEGVHDSLGLGIRKWEVLAEADEFVACGAAGSTCALCHVYAKGCECPGCPVFEATELYDCRGTPFSDYFVAASNNREQRDAARRELEFLKSLKDKPEKYPQQHCCRGNSPGITTELTV